MLYNSAFRVSLLTGIAMLGLCSVASGFSVNKSITVGANTETDGQSTVNGSISVGQGATINGSLETVNGQITVDDQARARDVETVNGSIKLGAQVTVDDLETVNGSIRVGDSCVITGSITAVNGKIFSGTGTRIEGNVSNVNGEIEIDGTVIEGNLETVNGDIQLIGDSVLQGDLTVEKPGGWNWTKSRKPRVVIGPGARVEGEIHLDREVELYISDSAIVGGVSGKMTMDDAVRFGGARP
ncbi:MAG: hypothetical protein WBM54_02245 [Woeseia sp.]